MDDTLEAQVGRLLKERRLTIATAESCTGGLVTHRLTNVPGSSVYLVGGVVSYSNEAKKKLLGVSHETLQLHGAVSRETALEMALGARRVFGTDLAVSVTGIAGPDGGTAEKPVGLSYIGLVAEGHEEVERYIWHSDRMGNKNESADAALRMIQDFIRGEVREGTGYARASRAEGGKQEPTAVEAEIRSDGSVRPRSFVWQGERRQVADVGRQWIEGQERHMLVMTHAQETFELVLMVPAISWMVLPVGPTSRAV